jgi:hypothetical protein
VQWLAGRLLSSFGATVEKVTGADGAGTQLDGETLGFDQDCPRRLGESFEHLSVPLR